MNTVSKISLHDAELISVEIDRSHSYAKLIFKMENGETKSVELQGVKAFRSEDLILQNVVSRLLCSSWGDIADDHLDRWLIWATSMSDSSSWLSDQHKDEWRTACIAKTLKLLVFEPSMGAQIVAVCDDLSIT
jgi:hypothetical protein